VMMLAEKAADLIRGDTPLPPEPTPFYRREPAAPPPETRRRTRRNEPTAVR
jgi:choline dehydrogenase